MPTAEELEAMVVRLYGDTEDYQQAMEEAVEETETAAAAIEEFGGKIESIGESMSSVGKKMSLAVTAPLTALGAYSMAAWSTQEKAEVTLKGLLDALQKPTELFDEYKEFASDLQKITTTGDESTLEMLKMAEALGVTGDAAKTAVKEAMGLGAAIDMNAKSAARYTAMLAMGDATMLNRYLPGLRMITDKTEQVAYAHEQLGKMFAVAESEAGTFGGMLVRMWNEFGDFAEEVGRVLANDLKAFVEWMKDTLEKAKAMNPAIFRIGVYIGLIAAAAGPVLIALGALVSAFGVFLALIPFMAAGLAMLPGLILTWTPPILVVIGLIAGLVAAIVIFWDELKALVSWVKGKFLELIEPFKDTIKGIKDALTGGDIQLAWEILWTQIQLKFYEVTRNLRKGWALFQRDISKALGANLLAFGFIDQETYDIMVQDATAAVNAIDNHIEDLRNKLAVLNTEAAGVARGFKEYVPDMDGEFPGGSEDLQQFEALQAGAVETIQRGTLQETILRQEASLAFIERGPTKEETDSKNIEKTANNTERIAEGQERLADEIFGLAGGTEEANFKG